MPSTEISRRLGHTKARVHRHLVTLRSLGFVQKDVATDGYRLSWKIYRLGMAVAESFNLHRLARRHLATLRTETGHNVLLAGATDGGATILDTLVGLHDYVITVRPGTFIDDEKSSTLVRVIRAFGERSGVQSETASPNPAPNTGAWIRKYWHDMALNERAVGFGTLACPIFDASDKIVGAITISGPIKDFSGPRLVSLVKKVKRVAMDISAEIHSTTWARGPSDAAPWTADQ